MSGLRETEHRFLNEEVKLNFGELIEIREREVRKRDEDGIGESEETW